ncbi:MAG: hypothetical protein CVU50_00125 [Candidatus Cloacimonetes bacterium HGW-Cloacimonetes-3]|jgi:hypothetical protein|nr:MAG: hypothetical protein CVU50_00125 [Candidatus Cloacimonetes bacterium HGW-Cloacimonetes-3]
MLSIIPILYWGKHTPSVVNHIFFFFLSLSCFADIGLPPHQVSILQLKKNVILDPESPVADVHED